MNCIINLTPFELYNNKMKIVLSRLEISPSTSQNVHLVVRSPLMVSVYLVKNHFMLEGKTETAFHVKKAYSVMEELTQLWFSHFGILERMLNGVLSLIHQIIYNVQFEKHVLILHFFMTRIHVGHIILETIVMNALIVIN